MTTMSEEVALDVDGQRMRYRTTDVLHDVTFQARRGQVLALLGPNGADDPPGVGLKPDRPPGEGAATSRIRRSDTSHSSSTGRIDTASAEGRHLVAPRRASAARHVTTGHGAEHCGDRPERTNEAKGAHDPNG
jgi:hypothetical protein